MIVFNRVKRYDNGTFFLNHRHSDLRPQAIKNRVPERGMFPGTWVIGFKPETSWRSSKTCPETGITAITKTELICQMSGTVHVETMRNLDTLWVGRMPKWEHILLLQQ